jgi:hypothetical protein
MGLQLREDGPQFGFVVGEGLVVQALTGEGEGEGAGVVEALADVDAAEHLVGAFGSCHPLTSVSSSLIQRQADRDTRVSSHVTNSDDDLAGPYERSPASAAAGDNTPQIMRAQGKSVMPAAVACHPIAGDAKKVTGGHLCGCASR